MRSLYRNCRQPTRREPQTPHDLCPDTNAQKPQPFGRWNQSNHKIRILARNKYQPSAITKADFNQLNEQFTNNAVEFINRFDSIEL